MSSGDRQPEPIAQEDAVETSAKDVPLQLGALEEDDEFEEFPVQDWDDSETDLSHITAGSSNAGKNQSGSSAGGSGVTDALWEDNWDDDDVEDDFSKQLREELAKNGSTTADTTMNT